MHLCGHAALFDIRDRGGDIIRKGAFATAHAPVPLLWQHDPARRIGTAHLLFEDGEGLFVEAAISASGGTAQAAARMLADGRVTGLSFGYRVRDARPGPPARGGMPTRELTAVELVEISLVTNPMQPAARVCRIIGADGVARVPGPFKPQQTRPDKGV